MLNQMSPELVSEKDLKAWLDYKNPGDVEKWCKNNRVPYAYGKGGTICTTVSAINNALFGAAKKEVGEIRFT